MSGLTEAQLPERSFIMAHASGRHSSAATWKKSEVKQKVSGQFLKEETAKEFAAVRTCTETCRKNGINEYEALERLMAGNPYTMQEILAGVT